MTSTVASRIHGELEAAFVDEAAFRAWYDRVLPRVYAFLADRCGGPGALAEELTQQTFVEAVRHRAAFDGRSDVVTWLCGIGRHKLADHFRRIERDERSRLRMSVTEIDVGDGSALTDEREAIERAIRSLPAAQRAALVFRHVDGRSVREIARLLDRSETAIESLLARARTNFRVAYEGRNRG